VFVKRFGCEDLFRTYYLCTVLRERISFKRLIYGFKSSYRCELLNLCGQVKTWGSSEGDTFFIVRRWLCISAKSWPNISTNMRGYTSYCLNIFAVKYFVCARKGIQGKMYFIYSVKNWIIYFRIAPIFKILRHWIKYFKNICYKMYFKKVLINTNTCYLLQLWTARVNNFLGVTPELLSFCNL